MKSRSLGRTVTTDGAGAFTGDYASIGCHQVDCTCSLTKPDRGAHYTAPLRLEDDRPPRSWPQSPGFPLAHPRERI